MPGGNGMGPENRGPMTGRGLGICSGNNSPGRGFGMGYARGAGRGFGRGGGRGYGGGYNRGWGYQYPVVITPEEQARNLENEKNLLELRLEEVQAELEKSQSTLKTT